MQNPFSIYFILRDLSYKIYDYSRSRRLGDALKRAREAQGLRQGELAEKIAVAPCTILYIENYKGNPTLEILILVIRTLKINPREIFYPEVNHIASKQQRLQFQITDYTDEELDILIPTCQSILST